MFRPLTAKPHGSPRHGWVEGDASSRLDVIHARLFEDLPGNRVRILTQESQKGVPAQELARTVPNPMINGHRGVDRWAGECSDARKVVETLNSSHF